MEYNSQNIQIAKNMRSNMTKEEVKLWNILRAKRFYNYKFKRQVPIGNYIVDFLCKEKNLIVEIDGGQHNEKLNKIKDIKRTNYLESKGYKVIRFWNNEVWNNIEGVCSTLKKELEALCPPPAALRHPREIQDINLSGGEKKFLTEHIVKLEISERVSLKSRHILRIPLVLSD